MKYKLKIKCDDDCALSIDNYTFPDLSALFESDDEEKIKEAALQFVNSLSVLKFSGKDDHAKEVKQSLKTFKRHLAKTSLTDFFIGGNREIVFKKIHEPEYDFEFKL